MTSGKKVKYTN